VSKIPKFVRQMIYDAINGAVVAVFALQFAIPGSLDEAKSQSLILGAAILRAVIGASVAAARKAIPAFSAYVAAKLQLEGDSE
jgi:hypothetical protein